MDGANAASAESPNKASSLALRLLSALALIPIIGAAAWWPLSTSAVVGLCVVLGIIELYGIMRQGGYAPRVGVGITIGILLCLAATFQSLVPSFDLGGLVVGASIVLALSYELLPQNRSNSLVNWALTFTGAYYIGGLLSYYILLGQLNTPLQGGWLSWLPIPSGTAWIILTLGITWLQDTAAYFVGRRFGRHPMAPILSPKKSWEGAVGGFLTSIGSAFFIVALFGLPVSWPITLLIGAVAGLAGPLGDLAESLIKRQIGVKDSGQLIPGHGGILDRVDSLLFTAIVVYYLALLTL